MTPREIAGHATLVDSRHHLPTLRELDHRATCSCGWAGEPRETWHEADRDARVHVDMCTDHGSVA